MKHYKFITYILSFLVLLSCIEPVELSTLSFDTNLVVQGQLTNEVKTHVIELSRTIPIDSTRLDPERNARVFITDNSGMTYIFQETNSGIYTSVNQFAAEGNKQYTLNIETSNGQKYTSTEEALPEASSISNLNVGIETNNLENIQELTIKVDSNTSGAEGNYYRYEYEETYKIRTPVWHKEDLIIVSDTPPYEFELIEKTEEEYGIGFCYPEKKSKELLLTETFTLSQDQVVGFPIRQIPVDSYIIGLRYSILVKQHVLNRNTYDFYTLLNKFSDPDDIFSQTQVGNIPSNITSVSNPTEDNVIGFFEVSSVSSKRIFFNRTDYFDFSTPFTNYWELTFCVDAIYPLIQGPAGNSPLADRLNNGWIYFPSDEPSPPGGGPYRLIRRSCGECSHLGVVNPPEYWIE